MQIFIYFHTKPGIKPSHPGYTNNTDTQTTQQRKTRECQNRQTQVPFGGIFLFQKNFFQKGSDP
jgi:hypothetical protein